MKKITLFIILLTGLANANTLILPAAPVAEHPETQIVIVSGIGRTEEAALRNAMATAVDRVAGTVLTSEIYIKNSELIDEKITRLAPSYVVSYNEIQRSRSEDLYKITIEANVAKRRLANALTGINVAVLEVDDSAKAHSVLLASISDYTNNIETIRKTFKRSFGNANSLMDITIKEVTFHKNDVSEGNIPVSVVFNTAFNPLRYEEARKAVAQALVENIGAKETKNIIKAEFDYDPEDNKLKFKGVYDARKDYRILLARPQGSSYVFDAYDFWDLGDDMRQMVFTEGVIRHKLVNALWNGYVHITFRDSSGNVLLEDYVPLITRTWIQEREPIPQTGLSVIWSGEHTAYQRPFGLREHAQDNRHALLNCAMIYTVDGDCVTFRRNDRSPSKSAAVIMPYFELSIGPHAGGAFRGYFADNLTFEYNRDLPLELAERVATVTVDTVNIDNGLVQK